MKTKNTRSYVRANDKERERKRDFVLRAIMVCMYAKAVVHFVVQN